MKAMVAILSGVVIILFFWCCVLSWRLDSYGIRLSKHQTAIKIPSKREMDKIIREAGGVRVVMPAGHSHHKHESN